jgi:hypothetical protein
MGVTSFIKGFDKYGYEVTLNFNKSGDRVKTLCGGLVSILTGIAIYSFLILKMKTMFLYENNEIGLVDVEAEV